MIQVNAQRSDDKQIVSSVQIDGTTSDVIDELAAGMAAAITMLADDLPVADSVHEQLAQVICIMVQGNVSRNLADREAATDKPPEA